MPSPKHFRQRREQFLSRIEGPVLLVAGGEIPRNYPANVSPYRSDSNFLFFFDQPEPGSAALFDPADQSVTLFLHERTPEDALWHGPVPSFAEMATKHGAQVESLEGLADTVRARAGGRKVESIAVADHKATALARAITGQDLDFYDAARVGSPELIQTIGGLRLVKDEAEDDAGRMSSTF